MNLKDGDESAKPEETDVEEVLEAQTSIEGQTYSDFKNRRTTRPAARV